LIPALSINNIHAGITSKMAFDAHSVRINNEGADESFDFTSKVAFDAHGMRINNECADELFDFSHTV